METGFINGEFLVSSSTGDTPLEATLALSRTPNVAVTEEATYGLNSRRIVLVNGTVPASESELPAGHWKVRFVAGRNFKFPDFEFDLEPGETVDIHKAMVEPLPPKTVTVTSVFDRQRAERAASAAETSETNAKGSADSALDSLTKTLANGLTVDTSAGTRVMFGDVMLYGDTGWRDIESLLINGWTTTNLLIRRVADNVYLQLNGLNRSDATDIRFLAAIPGFNPSNNELWLPWAEEPQNVILRFQSQNYQRANYTSGRLNGYGSFNWTTRQSWPTTLPGTPAYALTP